MPATYLTLRPSRLLQVRFVFLGFPPPPHLNMQKNLLIMGPNNTKTCSLKCHFIIFNYE
jgi:hypothetical protein